MSFKYFWLHYVEMDGSFKLVESSFISKVDWAAYTQLLKMATCKLKFLSIEVLGGTSNNYLLDYVERVQN